MEWKRCSGILMPISSLPGGYGIGSLAELPKCEYTVAMSQIQMWNEMLRVRDCVREARKADAGETKA